MENISITLTTRAYMIITTIIGIVAFCLDWRRFIGWCGAYLTIFTVYELFKAWRNRRKKTVLGTVSVDLVANTKPFIMGITEAIGKAQQWRVMSYLRKRYSAEDDNYSPPTWTWSDDSAEQAYDMLAEIYYDRAQLVLEESLGDPSQL